MGVIDAATRAGEDVLRQRLPKLVDLFASLLMRRARPFQSISEAGTRNDRLLLTLALMLVCAASAILISYMDQFNDVRAVVDAGRLGMWAAVVPLIIVLPLYLFIRQKARSPILFTLFNLSLVTSSLLTVVPSLISLLGAQIISHDFQELRAGRGAGTHLHQIYCGNIEDRAATHATVKATVKNSAALAENSAAQLKAIEKAQRNQARMSRLMRQLMEARSQNQPEENIILAGNLELERGLSDAERSGRLIRQGLALTQESLTYQERYLELQWRTTAMPVRLLQAYPVAGVALALALLVGTVIWTLAATVAWKLTVPLQRTRIARALTGSAIVLLFFATMVSFGLIRSGMLEAMLQPVPSLGMVEQRMKQSFNDAQAWCGPLKNHGAW
jgi:hypothetical protein